MWSSINIMESIAERPTKKCSSCSVVRSEPMFWDCKRACLFKTCEKCRSTKKKARDNKVYSLASSSSSSLPTPESSGSQSSWTSAPERPSSSSSSSSPDEWALMTSERLDAMPYEEICDIPTNINTVVSALNVF